MLLIVGSPRGLKSVLLTVPSKTSAGQFSVTVNYFFLVASVAQSSGLANTKVRPVITLSLFLISFPAVSVFPSSLIPYGSQVLGLINHAYAEVFAVHDGFLSFSGSYNSSQKFHWYDWNVLVCVLSLNG